MTSRRYPFPRPIHFARILLLIEIQTQPIQFVREVQSIDRSIGWKTGEIKRGGWRAMGQLRSYCFVESELASFRFDWKFYQLEKIALTDLSSRVIIENFDKRDTAVYNPPDLDFLHSPFFHGLLLTTLRPAIIYINNRCKLLMMGEKSKVEN